MIYASSVPLLILALALLSGDKDAQKDANNAPERPVQYEQHVQRDMDGKPHRDGFAKWENIDKKYGGDKE